MQPKLWSIKWFVLCVTLVLRGSLTYKWTAPVRVLVRGVGGMLWIGCLLNKYERYENLRKSHTRYGFSWSCRCSVESWRQENEKTPRTRRPGRSLIGKAVGFFKPVKQILYIFYKISCAGLVRGKNKWEMASLHRISYFHSLPTIKKNLLG